MVVTCYSRTCSRPELPISSAERKCVRAYARVHERAHAYRCNDTVHERTTQEQEGTYTSVECERICRLLWCLRLLLQWRWKRRRRRRRVRKKKNATATKSATRNVTISSLFFSRFLFLFLSLSLFFNFPLAIHLFLSCSGVLWVSEIDRKLLRFIPRMCSFSTTFAANDTRLFLFPNICNIKKFKGNFTPCSYRVFSLEKLRNCMK